MKVCAYFIVHQASQPCLLFNNTFFSHLHLHSFSLVTLFEFRLQLFLTPYTHIFFDFITRNSPFSNMKTSIIIASLVAVISGAPLASLHSRQAGGNFQTFTAALGGIAATPIVDSGIANRKFQVKNDTFVNIGAALQRSCDQQFNACANLANGGGAAFTVAECSAQKSMYFQNLSQSYIVLTLRLGQCDATAPASAAAAQGSANSNAKGNAQPASNGDVKNGNQAATCT
jgi:hypothetical protein